jgi:hypothetical protein
MAATKTVTSTKSKQAPKAGYAACEECGAPMDDHQRYCINCAARRKDTGGPAVQYFAGSSRRVRRASGAASAQASGGRAAAVIFLILLPIAVAVGVLVGKGGKDDNSDELLAAIQGINSGTGTGTLASASTDDQLASDFTLDEGFTVVVKTLPIEGTDQAAADAAKAEATKSGAADVGIINPRDFTLTPDQGAGNYVVYSGEFKTKAEATKALGKLKSKFKDAEVVAVKRAADPGAGKVVAQTDYGTVHQVEGFTPSAEKIQQDAQTVDDISKKIGDDFVGAQKDLPDVIVVGGSGGGGSGPSGPDN